MQQGREFSHTKKINSNTVVFLVCNDLTDYRQ